MVSHGMYVRVCVQRLWDVVGLGDGWLVIEAREDVPTKCRLAWIGKKVRCNMCDLV